METLEALNCVLTVCDNLAFCSCTYRTIARSKGHACWCTSVTVFVGNGFYAASPGNSDIAAQKSHIKPYH